MALFPDSVIKNSVEVYSAGISVKSRIIYLIIILTVLAVIISLPLIYVDISVQSRGHFQSDIEKQLINAPVQGRVSHNITRSGQSVKRGDTLLVINSEGLKAKKQALRSVHNQNQMFLHDLQFLVKIPDHYDEIDDVDLITPEYRSELISLKRMMEIHKHRYQNTRSDYLRNQKLYDQGVISQIDYESALNRYAIERDNLKQQKAQQNARWQNDLNQIQNETTRLLADIEQIVEDIQSHIVTAPVAGSIIRSADIQSGAFLLAGQMIAEISPDGDLLAVFHISPADIGFIKTGQQIRIQVDAFNHHNWGMLTGSIIKVSDDLISDGSSAWFRIHAKPDSIHLALKNGVTSSVTKGMTFTARVMITRRSLFDLLFDKADNWMNPYNDKRGMI